MKSLPPTLAALMLAGCSFCAAAAPVYEPIHAFEYGVGTPGRTGLLLQSDGSFLGVSETGGAYGFGVLYQLKQDGTVRLLSHFGGPELPGGGGRKCDLMRDAAGIIWSATSSGGTGGEGTVFKFDPATEVTTTVVQFATTGQPSPGAAPEGGLALGSDGFLWGTCSRGGLSGNGAVYKLQPQTGAVSFVASFTGPDGALPGRWPTGVLTADAAGNLWGVTAWGGADDTGTVFKVHPATGVVTNSIVFTSESGLHPGRLPQAALLAVSGQLWGTTQEGGLLNHGTVFRLDPATETLTTVIQFGNYIPTGPTDPASRLCLAGDGKLWGTSIYGGTSNAGTLFNIVPGTGLLTVAASFGGSGIPGSNPSAGLVRDSAGALWGTSSPLTSTPLAFKIMETSAAWQVITKFPIQPGLSSYAGLEADDSGQLWGLCANGGTAGFGTLYKLDPLTDTLTHVLNCGTGTVMARNPIYSLTKCGGMLYGQSSGGTTGFGTVYRFDPATGSYATLGEITGDSGPYPGRSLVDSLFRRPDGTLTGVTKGVGRAITTNYGGLLNVDPATGAFDAGLSFPGGNIGLRTPVAGVYAAPDGKLWGTYTGTASSTGGIFSSSPSGLVTVLQFTGFVGNYPGSYPAARLVPDGASSLLGSTRSGGTTGRGTLFKYHIPTGAFSSLVSFTGNTGSAPGIGPMAELTPDGHGWFWGTTGGGGAGNHGTIFKVSPAGDFLSLFEFTQNTGPVPGRSPQSRLLLHSDGNFYGTTAEGGTINGRPAGGGQIFRLRFGPSPQTRPATGTGATAARLHGTVNPNGTPTTTRFEWGYSAAALTNTTPPFAAGSSTTTLAVTAVLTGLTPGATLHYRLRAENADQWQPQRGAILNAPLPLTDPITAWRAIFGPNAANPAIAGDLADPDGDGLQNLAEYACGTQPLLADAAPLAVTPLPDGRVTILWSQSAAAVDTTVTLRTSNNLATWNDTTGVTEVAPSPGRRHFQVTLSQALGTRIFVRLFITRP